MHGAVVLTKEHTMSVEGAGQLESAAHGSGTDSPGLYCSLSFTAHLHSTGGVDCKVSVLLRVSEIADLPCDVIV